MVFPRHKAMESPAFSSASSQEDDDVPLPTCKKGMTIEAADWWSGNLYGYYREWWCMYGDVCMVIMYSYYVWWCMYGYSLWLYISVKQNVWLLYIYYMLL